MTTPNVNDDKSSPAVRSLRKERAQQIRLVRTGGDDELDRGLQDSFPASDPPSVTNTTTAGDAPHRKHPRPM